MIKDVVVCKRSSLKRHLPVRRVVGDSEKRSARITSAVLIPSLDAYLNGSLARMRFRFHQTNKLLANPLEDLSR
jgi:hypothetical protein